MTTLVTILYFFALLFVVYKATWGMSQQFSGLVIIETMLTLIGTVADNPVSFVFALLMNFVLIFGIFALNWCSLYLADLTKALEQKRTGGRNQNELELNTFVKKSANPYVNDV